MIKKSVLFLIVVLLSFCSSSEYIKTQTEMILDKYYNIDYSKERENFYEIPKLNTQYVPQGICLVNSRKYKYRLISAYDYEKKRNSCLYIIDTEGNYIKTVYLKNSVEVHVGGITANNSIVYVCDSKNGSIRAYNSDEIYESNDGDIIDYITNYKINIIPSCISYNKYDNCIYVATFNRDNSSIMVRYSLNFCEQEQITIPKKIQGIAFLSNGTVALSQSYGVYNDSALLIGKIDNKKFINQDKTILPPCSEEIYTTSNDNIFILFESGSKKLLGNKKINKVILIKI